MESETRRKESVTGVLYLISTEVIWQIKTLPSGKKHANMNLPEPLSFVANHNKMTNAQMSSCLLIHRGRQSAIVSLLSSNCSVTGLRAGVWKVDSNVAVFPPCERASCRGQVSGTNTNHPQCDLRQPGNAQEDTKDLYAARALPCTHWKLHLAADKLLPTASFSPV